MKLKRNNILSIIFSLMTVVILTGCHSSQQASGTSYQSGDNVAYVTSSDEWATISCPVKVAIKSPSSISASGRAQMVRGKCIFISLRMLGFEVATLYADNDTIVVADKFNKRYFATGYTELREKYNLSISTLQDILLGRKVSLPNYNGLNIIMSLVSDDSPLLSSLTIEPSNSDNIYFTFGTPMTSGDIKLMSVANVNTKLKSKDIAASITWDSSKMTFNTDVNPSPTNTDGYTQIPLSAISSLIKAQ